MNREAKEDIKMNPGSEILPMRPTRWAGVNTLANLDILSRNLAIREGDFLSKLASITEK